MSLPEDAATQTVSKEPGKGLAIASASVGSVALVLALSTWAAWLLVRPEAQASLRIYVWMTVVFDLVLGALWFAALPAGVLAIVFGLQAGARRPGARGAAVLGTFLGLFAVTVALVGALVFVLAAREWTPVMYPMIPRVSG